MGSDMSTANLLVLTRTLFKSLADELSADELLAVWETQQTTIVSAPPVSNGATGVVELQPSALTRTTLLHGVIDLCHTLVTTASIGSSLHSAASDLLLALVSIPNIADVIVCAPYGGRLAVVLLQQILPAPTRPQKHTWRIARWAESIMHLPNSTFLMGAVKALIQRKPLPWPVSADERAVLLLLALTLHTHVGNEASTVIATVRDTDGSIA